MKVTPVTDYKAPKYKSFELKTGAKLAAGAAALALVAGMASGCSVIETVMDKYPKQTPMIEALDGDMVYTEDPPPLIEDATD